MIPILMITYNRLKYTRIALTALMHCRGAEVYVIDNGSSDGTVQWLIELNLEYGLHVSFIPKNIGIAGAMNIFLKRTVGCGVVGKVDNDTVVPPDFIERMLPHLNSVHIVQAKHPILKETHHKGFDAWVKNMPAKGALRFNHFVGGSGILFRRQIVELVPETNWKLYGWRKWQADHPQYIKAFATDVEVKLLDTDETGAHYEEFPDYYIETKRMK